MSDDAVEVSVRHLRDVDVVHVVGDVDVSNAADVLARVAPHTTTGRPVVVDLSQVPFIDSAGVRLLDAVVGGAYARGVAVRVVAPERGAVRLALRLTAFPDDLIDRTVADAVAALA